MMGNDDDDERDTLLSSSSSSKIIIPTTNRNETGSNVYDPQLEQEKHGGSATTTLTATLSASSSSSTSSSSSSSSLPLYGSTIEKEPAEGETTKLVNASSDSTTSDADTASSSSSFSTQQQQQQAVLLLNAVAIIWGTQHAVIKMVVAGDDAMLSSMDAAATAGGDTSSTAALFTLIRFVLAALLASPYTPGLQQLIAKATTQTTTTQLSPDDNDDSKVTSLSSTTVSSFSSSDVSDTTNAVIPISTLWRWGAELGVWMFCGFAFQAIGLQYTTAQKSGFLLYLNCKFVPLFAAVLFGKRISGATWASAAAAVVGTALLAVGGGSGSGSDAVMTSDSNMALMNQWNVGDVWSIAAAMTSAMFILRMEAASEAVQDKASELNAACLWVVAALSVVWTFASATTTTNGTTLQTISDMVQDHWLAFLYLGGIATAVCNWLQTKAQRYISAERACVIYAMDPVYGALFSAWWLGESLPGVAGYVGASLITVAAATNAFWESQQSDGDETTTTEERK